MTSPIDYITLFKMMEGTRQRDADPLAAFIKLQRYEETKARKKEEADKKKKEEDAKKKPAISYVEGVFWLFALSPLVGPLIWNFEMLIINSAK